MLEIAERTHLALWSHLSFLSPSPLPLPLYPFLDDRLLRLQPDQIVRSAPPLHFRVGKVVFPPRYNAACGMDSAVRSDNLAADWWDLEPRPR